VGLVRLKQATVLAGDPSEPRSLYVRSRAQLPSPRPNRPADLYPLTADLACPKSIRTPLDRTPSTETVAGRPFGLERPLPPDVARCPPQFGSASRPLGGNRPRRFNPLTLHDERPSLRAEYTNLTKALVFPTFVHDFKNRGTVPEGL